MGGWVGEWVDGWVGGWVGGCVRGWMGGMGGMDGIDRVPLLTATRYCIVHDRAHPMARACHLELLDRDPLPPQRRAHDHCELSLSDLATHHKVALRDETDSCRQRRRGW